MTRLLTTVAFSSLVLAGAASPSFSADPRYPYYGPPGSEIVAQPDGSAPSWRSPDGFTRDNSANDLNREALKRAIGTPVYPEPVYGSSGVPMTAPSYPGIERSTTTTTTTTIIQSR